jgi:hypothetical protein
MGKDTDIRALFSSAAAKRSTQGVGSKPHVSKSAPDDPFSCRDTRAVAMDQIVAEHAQVKRGLTLAMPRLGTYAAW